MPRAERLLVVASLAVSLVALAIAFRGPAGQQAIASAPLASDLGPADALLLNTEAGKDPLRLAAKDGRLAWSDRSTSRAWSVACVHIDRVLRAILRGASYEEKRREAQEAAKTEEAEFNRRLEELKAKFPAAEGAPPPPEAREAVAALQQEYSRWLEGVRRRDERIAAEQFETAYRELIAAVDAVAEKEQIDVVYRFVPTSDPFEVDEMGEAVGQIQARTFLKYPEAMDITPEVMKALNLAD